MDRKIEFGGLNFAIVVVLLLIVAAVVYNFTGRGARDLSWACVNICLRDVQYYSCRDGGLAPALNRDGTIILCAGTDLDEGE